MTATARKLRPKEFRTKARNALNRVFRAFDPRDEPFQDNVEEKIVLHVAGFWLEEEQFRGVCEAAEAIGEEALFYSVVRGYSGGPELMEYYTWELPLWDYEQYCDADETPFPKDHDIGIPLDRVLYSTSGSWGILLPDEFVLLGGSITFVGRFKQAYPDWQKDLVSFIEARTDAAKRRHADMTWVPRLLRHIYGQGAPSIDL